MILCCKERNKGRAEYAQLAPCESGFGQVCMGCLCNPDYSGFGRAEVKGREWESCLCKQPPCWYQAGTGGELILLHSKELVISPSLSFSLPSSFTEISYKTRGSNSKISRGLFFVTLRSRRRGRFWGVKNKVRERVALTLLCACFFIDHSWCRTVFQ